MQQIKFFTDDTKVTPENLGEAIQQAIEIEIATIPTYLYTYYSVRRVPDQESISGPLVDELTAKGMSLDEAGGVALNLSADIMVFSNKIGATIMSVAMEEMLHMALSSNLNQALDGQPLLVGKSPSFPAVLPGHIPEFIIDKAPFSLDQLITFLKIESPYALPPAPEGFQVIPYTTIGEFYNMIKKCIDENDLKYNTDAPQLVPGQRYYAPNMIDTVYYDKQHKPQYVDADDSGDLVQVVDRDSANKAIDQIVTQGEGNKGAQGFQPDGSVDCSSVVKADYDDPQSQELSHFEKFAQLYCDYEKLSKKFADYGLNGDILEYFVYKCPTNPRTADYTDAIGYPPGFLQALSTLINAVYTYIFVMTEACYRPEAGGNTPFEIFMFGIHKSMIFILDDLCGTITGYTYVSKKGGIYNAAPTFEDYSFDASSSPKSQLLELAKKVVALNPSFSGLIGRISDLPDVPLN